MEYPLGQAAAPTTWRIFERLVHVLYEIGNLLVLKTGAGTGIGVSVTCCAVKSGADPLKI